MRRHSSISLLIVLGVLLAVACSEEPEAAAGDTYTVRGKVVQVLEPPVGPEVQIAHEAIPDFVGRDGEVVGMAPMTMGFPAGDEVDLSGLEPGTPVEFTFRVDWEADRPLQLLEIRLLD